MTMIVSPASQSQSDLRCVKASGLDTTRCNADMWADWCLLHDMAELRIVSVICAVKRYGAAMEMH